MSVDRKRWGVVIGATIAMGVAAAPAYAEPDPGQVSAQLDNITVGAAGAPGKVRPMVVSGKAKDPKVTVDIAALDGIATVELRSNRCTTAGKTATCTLPSGVEFTDLVHLAVQPAPGAKAGDSGDIVYTSSADGVPAQERKAKVTIADGPDFIVLSGGEDKAAKLGDKVIVRVVFQNVGSQAGAGITIVFRFSQGLVPDAHGNCTYAAWPDAHGRLVECTFSDVVQPRKENEALGVDFGATVGPTALGGESVDYTVDPTASAPAATHRPEAQHGNGPELALTDATAQPIRAAGVDIDGTDNFGDTFFTGIANTLDVSASGATVSGQVGTTVTAKIGLKNNGAAALDSYRRQEPEPVIRFAFAVPAGAQVVTVPAGCASITENGPPMGEPGKAGGSYYICNHPGVFLGAGESFLLEFGLKIMSASGGTVSADIKTRDPVVYPDDKAANNTAAVTITIPAASGGGTLPITGRSTDRLVLVGALLLALGVALLVATRRRSVVD